MGFDFSNAEDVSNVVPAGVYNLRVAEAEEKTAASGSKMIKLVYVVTGPTQVGRKIFQNYMMEGNEQSVKIAQSSLKSLLKVGGKDTRISGVHEFVDIEISANVKVTPPKGNYGEGNAVGSFKPVSAEAQSANVPF